MNEIKMFAPITMDGFASRIDGDIDWAQKYLSARDYGYGDFLATIGGVVFNRRHYTTLMSYDFKWPYGDRPCFVVTGEHFFPPENRDFRFLTIKNGAKLGNRHIEQLRQVDGDIWLVGDNEMIARFQEMGLIDEVTLLVLPVTLGNGLPLATGSSREHGWQLTHCEKYDNGVVRVCYRRERE